MRALHHDLMKADARRRLDDDRAPLGEIEPDLRGLIGRRERALHAGSPESNDPGPGEPHGQGEPLAGQVAGALSFRNDPLQIQPPSPEPGRETVGPVVGRGRHARGECGEKAQPGEDRDPERAGPRGQPSSEYRGSWTL